MRVDVTLEISLYINLRLRPAYNSCYCHCLPLKGNNPSRGGTSWGRIKTEPNVEATTSYWAIRVSHTNPGI